MGNTSDSHDVVIIGGGIIGCSSARELASDHDVVLLEKDQIAGSASGKASGVVSFTAQRSVLPDFVEHSLSFFRNWEGTEHFEFVERNGVELTPEEKEEEARERVAGAQEHGFPLSFLPTEEIEEKYPDVFELSNCVGGIEYRDIGYVDPYTCTMSFKTEAEERGADIRTGVQVEDIIVSDGVVTGVETSEGPIYGDSVVCAAGWWSRELLEGLVDIPVRPLRYQAVDLKPDRDLGDSYPIGFDPVTDFYWRPQDDGTLHIGGGDYLVEDVGHVRENVTEDFRMKIATEVPNCLKGFKSAEILSEDTCPTGDAATPDSLPIIDDPAGGPEGLVVATGFHGYGIMASPGAGRAVRALVTNESCSFEFDALSVDRFETTSPDFGLISLSEKRAKFG